MTNRWRTNRWWTNRWWTNRWWRADGGGITPMVATFILVIFMALGISVDGSGMLRARHRIRKNRIN